MINKVKTQKNYQELVEEFRANYQQLKTGEILKFKGFKNKIIYNTTAPFEVFVPSINNNLKLLFARVESLESFWLNPLQSPAQVWDPEVVACVKEDDNWVKLDETKIGLKAGSLTFKNLEDPFISKIQGELVLGGVSLDFNDLDKLGNPRLVTKFFKGDGIHDLKEFQSIKEMKDIRLVSLPDNQILIATRPQGGVAGIGMIGLKRINSLNQLTQENINNSILIKDQVSIDTKLGSNELHLLENNGNIEVGVLMHIAAIDLESQNLNYASGTFIIKNPYSFEQEGINVTEIKVIAERNCWPESKAKTETLKNVIFPSGLIKEAEDYYLFAGLSDAEEGMINIKYPF